MNAGRWPVGAGTSEKDGALHVRTRKSPNTRPRVLVSLAQDEPKVSRNADSIRDRLKNGAKLVVVNTGAETIDLTDKDLVGSGQDWTLRITGTSSVRIHLTTPLPANAQIVATDTSFVEATGHVTVHAYTRATVHAFDQCTVHARNHAVVSVCDWASALAVDDAVISAYDTARVNASGRAQVTAGDSTSVHLSESARASVCRGVRVTGPARANLHASRSAGRSQQAAHGR
ncbi:MULTISPECIES: hypothetical protein [Rhodococcus]|jgi:hypothetical protein|uniref:hypothetical protein n=1 Tax=Rhodococcus TaxID=1827 RepID=UPI001E131AD4|nr:MULTISPECIES: hypothetical protein [Rhodococcus]MBP2527535.1 hypothetical protein [Rhodococcus sp. PvP104]MDA3637607.1 hypothetical protein [Rhodococcus sp. C-2]